MSRSDPSAGSAGLDRFGHGWTAAKTALRGRVCVLSPHLDDAALSLGASLARAARAGADIHAITVFAGKPESDAPASSWDAKAGFTSLSEATAARRLEDAEACRLLGVTPVWLSFADSSYGDGAQDADIWAALAPSLDGAALVLAPGFPLIHEDHLRLCRLVRARLPRELVGYYLEQPYAAWLRSGFSTRRPAEEEIARVELEWRRLLVGPRGWAAKARALRSYPSQMRLMHEPASAIASYECRRGGETVALPGFRSQEFVPKDTVRSP